MTAAPPRVGVSLLTAMMHDPEIRAAALLAVRTLTGSDLWPRVAAFVALDNGSTPTPEAEAALEVISERGRVLRVPRNSGIAAGRNAVLRELFDLEPDLDYVCEVHTDHVFPRAWAAPLLAWMAATPWQGMLGPGLLTPSGFFGGPVHAVRYGAPARRDEAALVDAAAEHARARYADRHLVRRGISHPSMKRVSALREIGPFYDERFAGQNFEDSDEVRRFEDRGWAVGVHLGAWVYHHYALTRLRTGGHDAAYWRNRAAFFEKWPDGEAWCAKLDADLHRMYAL